MTKPAVSAPTTLIFNTTLRDRTTVALVWGRQSKVIVAPVRAQELQRLAEELLHSQELSFDDVEAVAVLTGPGSFTGVRIGVVAANTFSWLTNQPIFEIAGDDINAAVTVVRDGQLKSVRQAQARY